MDYRKNAGEVVVPPPVAWYARIFYKSRAALAKIVPVLKHPATPELIFIVGADFFLTSIPGRDGLWVFRPIWLGGAVLTEAIFAWFLATIAPQES